MISKDLIYKNDYDFNDPTHIGDYGDNKAEMSMYVDCEDFNGFYMRNMRLLCSFYQYMCPKDSSVYKHCTTLAKHFTPLALICQILVQGHKEFHSTLLLIPTEESKLKTISFEVTSPDKSLDLSIKEDLDCYNKWHINHYFLVDSEFIYRVPPQMKIENLNLKIIENESFNY